MHVLPMVPAVYHALNARRNEQGNPQSGWVFPAESKSGHLDRDTAKAYHSRALESIEVDTKKTGKADSGESFPTVHHETHGTDSACGSWVRRFYACENRWSFQHHDNAALLPSPG